MTAPLGFFSGAPVAHSGANKVRHCWICPKVKPSGAKLRHCALCCGARAQQARFHLTGNQVKWRNAAMQRKWSINQMEDRQNDKTPRQT